MRLDLTENIVFPFSDPSWIAKMLTALACLIFFPMAPAFVGYTMLVIRGSASGADRLPEWRDLGALWSSGMVALLGLSAAFFVPFAIAMPAILVVMVLASGDGMGMAAGFSLVVLLLLLLAWLSLIFLVPAMILRYTMTGEPSSFFNFPSLVLDIKQGVPDYVMISLFPVVASLPLTVLALLVPGLGVVVSFLLMIPFVMFSALVIGRMMGKFFDAYFFL